MQGKWWTAGALAAAGVLALVLPVRAGDTHKLVLPRGAAEAPTLNLVDGATDADTVDVHRGSFGNGFRSNGFRGNGFRFDNGFRGNNFRFSNGFRFGNSFRYGGFYGYYPRYRYYGYYPRYYASAYYYAPPVYYSAPGYYSDPCLYPSAGVSAPVVSLNIAKTPVVRGEVLETMPTPLPTPAALPSEDATYPYDGGPRVPLPMPRADPAQSPEVAPPSAPVDGHSVSLPLKVAGKLTYPAYGEKLNLPGVAPVEDRGVLVKGDAARKLTK